MILDAIFGGFTGAVNNMLQYEANQDNYELAQENLQNTKYWNAKNYALAEVNSEKNFALQQAQQDWDKQAQNTTWAREDAAVQRRAADLQAAGLSKTLAAGSAAQSSSPMHITAPQMATPKMATLSQADVPVRQAYQLADIAGIVRSAMQQNAEITKTQMDTKLSEQQAARIAEERKGLEIDNLAKADMNKEELERRALANVILQGSVDQIALDKKIKQLGITSQEIRNRIENINATIAEKFGLSSAQVEIIAKQQALANAKLDYEAGTYNLGVSQGMQIRTNDAMDKVSATARGVAGTLDKALMQIVEGIRSKIMAGGK